MACFHGTPTPSNIIQFRLLQRTTSGTILRGLLLWALQADLGTGESNTQFTTTAVRYTAFMTRGVSAMATILKHMHTWPRDAGVPTLHK